MTQLHQLFAFCAFFQLFHISEDFLEQWYHVIIGVQIQEILVKTQFLPHFPKGVKAFYQKFHRRKLFQVLDKFLDNFLTNIVLHIDHFLYNFNIILNMNLDLIVDWLFLSKLLSQIQGLFEDVCVESYVIVCWFLLEVLEVVCELVLAVLQLLLYFLGDLVLLVVHSSIIITQFGKCQKWQLKCINTKYQIKLLKLIGNGFQILNFFIIIFFFKIF